MLNLFAALAVAGGGMMLTVVIITEAKLVFGASAIGIIAGAISFFRLGTLLWAVELYAKGRSNA